MKITEAEIEHIANLANLEVTDADKAELASQLSTILEYVGQLDRLNLAGVEPTSQLVTGSRHAIRDDRTAARPGSADAGRTVKLFKVPRVITER